MVGSTSPRRGSVAARLLSLLTRPFGKSSGGRPLRDFARRHRLLVAVAGIAVTTGLLAYALAGRRAQFAAALSGAAWWILAITALLHVIALLARSEAWHVTIAAAGGDVGRRALFRASSAQVLGSLVNGQLGAAARIFALRRTSPGLCPQVP